MRRFVIKDRKICVFDRRVVVDDGDGAPCVCGPGGVQEYYLATLCDSAIESSPVFCLPTEAFVPVGLVSSSQSIFLVPGFNYCYLINKDRVYSCEVDGSIIDGRPLADTPGVDGNYSPVGGDCDLPSCFPAPLTCPQSNNQIVLLIDGDDCCYTGPFVMVGNQKQLRICYSQAVGSDNTVSSSSSLSVGRTLGPNTIMGDPCTLESVDEYSYREYQYTSVLDTFVYPGQRQRTTRSFLSPLCPDQQGFNNVNTIPLPDGISWPFGGLTGDRPACFPASGVLPGENPCNGERSSQQFDDQGNGGYLNIVSVSYWRSFFNGTSWDQEEIDATVTEFRFGTSLEPSQSDFQTVGIFVQRTRRKGSIRFSDSECGDPMNEIDCGTDPLDPGDPLDGVNPDDLLGDTPITPSALAALLGAPPPTVVATPDQPQSIIGPAIREVFRRLRETL